MQGAGQCTPQRLLADEDMVATLSQMTAWRMQGSAVVLEGPRMLKFRASDH